ncbi:cryptochrome/photolyase family protein [Xylophilus ampelinus]|uniref:Deoxyribodipyrimidine photo-lyase n=1 Tax=Xylophilus ampelinus TaxID=54067 RepID=A0A318SIC8_9BURK|nr:deoxyribodipyrimidine photo-lyase [Xylophilus ampelinus]MCS4511520.1 DNA photolyase family protein [Xylophilus ampelinus]PYE74357.1 deoxyribodipyrimidine photo-lyase [Xylophilus ampelinus]
MQHSDSPKFDSGLVWFRRDLRTDDNAPLYHALRNCRRVYCCFVFDTDILYPLPRADRRVEFIQASLVELDADLKRLADDPAAGLIVRHAKAEHDVAVLAKSLGVQAVFAGQDDEPGALARDAQVLGALANAGIVLQLHKDHSIFARDEVMTQAGTAFGVYTPYKNAWLKKLDDYQLKAYPVAKYRHALAPRPEAHRHAVPTLTALGFEATNLSELQIPTGASGAHSLFEDFFDRIDDYGRTRDFPGAKGPSYLGVHLRFGTVSIRRLAATAHQLSLHGSRGAAVWLGELIWRDFFFQVMYHAPHVIGHAYRPEYDAIKWEHGKQADAAFAAWCEGRTGYPLVDAAMLQINRTGYMHNRLRMVTAAFLVKDLGIDWRRGEAYFALHLNDFELSSNNGNWQWAASTGCDAQPWFRIFNPVTQSQKFDAEGRFIRRYLPRLARLPDDLIHMPWQAKPVDLEAAGLALGKDYPKPIVEHALAREKTLERYGAVKRARA